MHLRGIEPPRALLGPLRSERSASAVPPQVHNFGRHERIRTSKHYLLRIAALPVLRTRRNIGAGSGNRTHVASLENSSPAIERHPHLEPSGIAPESR